MAEWKDTSSWSQSDRDRSVPKEWTLSTGRLDIVIHHFLGYGAMWFVTCRDIDMHRMDLNTSDAGRAKGAAVEIVHDRLRRMLESLP